jgi:transcriptional regulator with XRE-family HTH domain
VTGEQLRGLLAEIKVSTRQLAAELEVSAMWVSRRTTGEVPISDEDWLLITDALDAIRLRRARASL